MTAAATVARQWAAAFPDVAATWHPSRNGNLAADAVGRSWPTHVWWRCPVGHEWREQINARLALPKWKNGNRAACRECSDSPLVLQPYTYPDCGHTRKIIKKTRDRRPARCWDCVRRQQGEAWQKAAATARESAPQATELVGQIEQEFLSPGVEPPLAWEFHRHAMKFMQGAIGAEQAGVRPGAIGNVKGQLRQEARELPPSIRKVAVAAENGGMLRMLDQSHWAAGWLYRLTGHPMRPVPGDTTAETVRVLTTWLEAQVETMAVLRERFPGIGEMTSLTTDRLTQALRDAARANHCNAYRELRLPVLARNDAVRYGRLDLVLWQPDFPDIVVEIDSAPNAGSARKLEFARDAGAIAIWVRHGSGSITAPRGVAVVDLRQPRRAS